MTSIFLQDLWDPSAILTSTLLMLACGAEEASGCRPPGTLHLIAVQKPSFSASTSIHTDIPWRNSVYFSIFCNANNPSLALKCYSFAVLRCNFWICVENFEFLKTISIIALSQSRIMSVLTFVHYQNIKLNQYRFH